MCLKGSYSFLSSLKIDFAFIYEMYYEFNLGQNYE